MSGDGAVLQDPLGAFCTDRPVFVAGAAGGPLAGLHCGIKDAFHIAGQRTGFGHPAWLRSHPPAEANAVAVQWMIDPILASQQHVKTGKLRAIAVSTAKRLSLAPGLPTIAKSGVPGYDFSAWFVLLAPAKTPAAVVEKMHAEVQRILALPEVKERFAQLGAEPGVGSTAQVGGFIAAEVKRYATVVKDVNMKAD